MSTTLSPDSPKNLKWYQGLDRYCWVVLIIAALGWLFDTMDQNLFNLVGKTSVDDLIRNSATLHGPTVRGWVTAAFLIGWSVGGFVFGILGDRIGRTGTMIATILIYAAFTGLSGLAWNWESYAFMRFMTGVGVGGEWAAGAAIVAEVFPERSRAMALGTLQALSAVGNMMAAVITFTMADLSWRWVYAVGAVPAILVFWIRRSVKEPEKWTEAKEQASLGKELGSISTLFKDPVLRRNTIAGLMMAIAGQGALWGVGFLSVDFLQTVVAPFGVEGAALTRSKSAMFLIQQVGAAIGIYLFAAFSQRTNRRKAFFLWFALAWASIPLFFWGVAQAGAFNLPEAVLGFMGSLTASNNLPEAARVTVVVAAILAFFMGFATLGPFSGYTVYFPELFPTRLRATGCGICYNGGRFLAAFAPVAFGALSAHFKTQPGAIAGGMPMAATVVTCIYILGFVGTWMGPETRDQALPD
ncbi:MAG: MFS transporter [Actinomycetota bacterium]